MLDRNVTAGIQGSNLGIRATFSVIGLFTKRKSPGGTDALVNTVSSQQASWLGKFLEWNFFSLFSPGMRMWVWLLLPLFASSLVLSAPLWWWQRHVRVEGSKREIPFFQTACINEHQLLHAAWLDQQTKMTSTKKDSVYLKLFWWRVQGHRGDPVLDKQQKMDRWMDYSNHAESNSDCYCQLL